MKRRTGKAILDDDFLEIRHRILDIAAALDRVDTGDSPGDLASDARMEQIRRAVAILGENESDRAQRVQHVFSQPYNPEWRS